MILNEYNESHKAGHSVGIINNRIMRVVVNKLL